jgi:rhodanese-related sulfurtransferase
LREPTSEPSANNTLMKDQSCKTSRWILFKAELNNLQPITFQQKIKAEELPIIIDVRTPGEFAGGHIQNAINIDYLASGFWEQIEVLPNSNNIFVYCRTGRRSIRACTLMKNGGFDKDKVFNLEGGYPLWLEEVG